MLSIKLFKITIHYILLSLFLVTSPKAQIDSLSKFSFTAYGEAYYSFDFARPMTNEKPSYIYNHKKHNQLNINLLIAELTYNTNKLRANMGLMAGNYAQFNLANEPRWAQHIYEANIGVKLSSKKNIWLDLGVMPSHIGFESALGANCWTLTRSLFAENSPYFETGAKMTYQTGNEKLLVSILALNGWQKIVMPRGINQPSFGLQINFKPNHKNIFNYSNFVGSDKPDSLKSLRHFHNFYWQSEPNSKFGLIVGFDIGFEKTLNKDFYHWYSPVVLVKKQIFDKVTLGLRSEYYFDKNQVIIATGTINGFQTLGLSSNLDFDISKMLKWRLEAKFYNSKDKIFEQNTTSKNYAITTCISARL